MRSTSAYAQQTTPRSVRWLWQAANSSHPTSLVESPQQLASCRVLIWPKSGSGLQILECRRRLGEDVIGQNDVADRSRHCNGPNQRAEY
jgi:hypothetical protein